MILEVEKIAKYLAESSLWRKIIYKKVAGSTNEVLGELEEKEVGTVVLASRQLNGRGKGGSTWYSPLGGCWVSVSLDPLSPEKSSRVSELAVGSIKQVVEHWGLEGRISPPNDLCVEGKKLAGVLVEPRPQFTILGLGINVNNKVSSLPQGVREKSTSMRDLLGTELCLEELIGRLLSNLESRYLDYIDKANLEHIQNNVKGRRA